jgi:hypothetical protein
MKKVLAIFIVGILAQVAAGPFIIGDVSGAVVYREGKGGQISSGGLVYLAQSPSRNVRLTGDSTKKVLPPPCTVVGIKGKDITVKDFYGKTDTVEVENARGIKVGDKVVVKDGLMIIGIHPE